MIDSPQWDEGWKAYKEYRKARRELKKGWKYPKCPYEYDTEEYEDWVDGWESSETHEKDPKYYAWMEQEIERIVEKDD